MEINIKLKNLRLDNRYTLATVAKKMNLGVATISAQELGTRAISIDILNRYAEIYNVNITYFYEDKVEKRSYVDELLKRLIDNKIIKDINNIPPDVVDSIMNAVKLELSVNKLDKNKS